ncbi:MAG: AAA family ATPase, partial [Minisyncoccia bacterium]
MRRDEFKEALRALTGFDEREQKLLEEKRELLSGRGRSGSTIQALREVHAELEALAAEREELAQASPEGFVALHLKELRSYRRALGAGSLAETPYVREVADDIESHVRAGQPVFVYGHLGSGKTELAMHVAKRFHEKGALIISGAKDIALSELYGHQILDVDKVDPAELRSFSEGIEKEFEAWKTKNPESSSEDTERAHERIMQTSLAALPGGGTISRFFLGPIYRAMEEGRPIILDEVNAIPHDVLISLNHILTRKPGDTVVVQQNSGSEITVKEGFGFILTGNLNQDQDIYN